MARSQGTPRGRMVKGAFAIGSYGLTTNSTGIVFSGGVKLSSAQGLSGNSTGIIFNNPEAALPETDNGAAITLISNSTGVALAVNSTGTTWKYLNVTSIQPT